MEKCRTTVGSASHSKRQHISVLRSNAQKRRYINCARCLLFFFVCLFFWVQISFLNFCKSTFVIELNNKNCVQSFLYLFMTSALLPYRKDLRDDGVTESRSLTVCSASLHIRLYLIQKYHETPNIDRSKQIRSNYPTRRLGSTPSR